MKISDFQRHSANIRNSLIVCFDPPKKMHVTFVGYSWNNQGILLHSIFPEHYLGIFRGISWGTFSEYSGNISWECFTNITQTIFPKHYLGIFPGISYGTFSEYSENISWECSTNIPRTYICLVVSINSRLW